MKTDAAARHSPDILTPSDEIKTCGNDPAREGGAAPRDCPGRPPLYQSLPVGVLIERRDCRHPWQSETWTPIEVVVDPPTAVGWLLLERGEGWEHYLSSGHRLELHRSDLASYRYNLAGTWPKLFVGLGMAAPGDEREAPVRVAMVTAAPDEAQSLMDSGSHSVEAVRMPAVVAAWVEAFVALHPPDPPMYKRRRDRVDVNACGAPPVNRGRIP